MRRDGLPACRSSGVAAWRPAVSEDRPLNHRTEFHLAFGLLSAESTTYLPVDLALLRLGPSWFVARLPLFVIVLPPRWASLLSSTLLIHPLRLVRFFPSPRRMRSARCTFHGCLQLRIMNIDNSSGPKKDRPSDVNISTTSRALATRAFCSFVLSTSFASSSVAFLPLSPTSSRSSSRSPSGPMRSASDLCAPNRSSYRARGILRRTAGPLSLFFASAGAFALRPRRRRNASVSRVRSMVNFRADGEPTSGRMDAKSALHRS